MPKPDLVDHLPIRIVFLLTSPTLRPPPSADRAGRIPIVFVAREHRPDHARHFVGQRDGYQHSRLTREHADESRPWAPALAAPPLHDGHRADNQQPSDIALTHL